MLITNDNMTQMKLYDVLQLKEEIDLCDKDWDIETTLVFDDDWKDIELIHEAGKNLVPKEDEYCMKYMKLVLLNMPVYKLLSNNSAAICDCSGFISNWRNVYTKFINEENRECWTERMYKARGSSLDPDVDDGFFEVYMQTFFYLLEGDYSERQYKKLFNYLMYENYLRDYYGYHSAEDDDYVEPDDYDTWYSKNN